MRVVVVTQQAPDPFGNAAARWYYVLLKGLAERGFDVSCWSIAEREEFGERARRHFEHVANVSLHVVPWKPRGPSLLGKLATLREPFSYFLSDEIRAGVRGEVERGYDVLHLEQLWCAYLGLGLPRTLVSVHHLQRLDLRGTGIRSWAFLRGKLLAWRAERTLLRRMANVRVTTDRLKREVSRLSPAARVRTIPVALDPSLYERLPVRADDQVVGLIATMNWEPGYNAALRLLRRVWPRVRAKAPQARLLLAGWRARDMLRDFVDEPGVTIAGDLDDASEFWRACSVLTYPLTRGSGMKLKVLESMALGVPVVTTSEGIEGVAAEQGRHAFVEDDDDRFAERVVQLLGDPEARRAMSADARALVEAHYSPKPTIDAVVDHYDEVCAAR